MSEIIEQPWSGLRHYTPARIGIGRAGSSQPTRVNLQFQRDHARARDAVLQPVDVVALQQALGALNVPVECIQTAAADRRIYLQRPDLGRQLLPGDQDRLRGLAGVAPQPFDIGIVVADGLSSQAVTRHALPLLQALLPLLQRYRVAPLCIATQARVALGDDVGDALGVQLSLVLIGERPGLSAADSLGIYLTWSPRPGRVDAERNCISNIRPDGLDLEAAARTCAYLVDGAFQSRQTGIGLKDQSQTLENTRDQRIPFLRPPVRT